MLKRTTNAMYSKTSHALHLHPYALPTFGATLCMVMHFIYIHMQCLHLVPLHMWLERNARQLEAHVEIVQQMKHQNAGLQAEQ